MSEMRSRPGLYHRHGSLAAINAIRERIRMRSCWRAPSADADQLTSSIEVVLLRRVWLTAGRLEQRIAGQFALQPVSTV